MFVSQEFGLFVAASLALNLTPGPDMLYVIARSSAEGKRAGVASALGIGAGTLVHIAAVALGLSAVLAAVPVAYEIVRWAGAAYLVWLGVTTIVRTPGASEQREVEPASLSKVFWQGAVTNVLNPKVALFFLAFLPQFTGSVHADPVAGLVILGLWFDVQGTLVNLGVAMVATNLASRFQAPAKRPPRRRLSLRHVVGGIFIAIGARLALSSR